jgi:hypothetical protein
VQPKHSPVEHASGETSIQPDTEVSPSLAPPQKSGLASGPKRAKGGQRPQPNFKPAAPTGTEQSSAEDQAEALLSAKRLEHTSWSVRAVVKRTQIVDNTTTVSRFGSSTQQTFHNAVPATVRQQEYKQIMGTLVSYKGNDVTIAIKHMPAELQRAQPPQQNGSPLPNTKAFKYGNFSLPDQKFLDEYRKLESSTRPQVSDP